MKSNRHGNWLLVAMLCIGLIMSFSIMTGCKGDTGPAGASGTNGSNGTNGTDATAASQELCLICHGPGTVANIKDMHAISTQSPITAPLTVVNGLVDINMQSAAQLAGFSRISGTISLVTIATVTPVINFSVNDGAGHGVIGLKSSNVRATIAQLVESPTSTFPSYWASYEVTATTRPTDTVTAANFVDNGNGTYTFTMNRDVTAVPGVTYNANATHRVAMRVYGSVAGGTLNEEPLDLTVDFVPSAVFPGTPTVRNIVAEGACDACHYQLGITTPHSGRDDPKYCVMCHTYQRATGRLVSAPSSTGLLSYVTPTTATYGSYIVSGQVDTVSSDPTATAGGYTSGEFVRMIHQIHKGKELSLKNYNYADVRYNEVTYPQDVRKCTTCHAGTQGGRHLTNPSRKACGACHDNISWVSPPPAGYTLHSNGDYSDDSQCALCHTPTQISNMHVAIAEPDPNNLILITAQTGTSAGSNANTNAACVVASNDTPPTGAIVPSYNIVSVTTTSVNGAQRPTITFSISLNGTPTSFNTNTAGQLFNNFVGSPSVYFAWSVPQDGITNPADFNASASGYIKNIWNGKATGTGAGTLNSSASPTYTIILTGVRVASDATMLTGGVGYTYNLSTAFPLTQTTGYTLSDPHLITACTFSQTSASTGIGTGGLIVPALDKSVVATGYTGRRSAVDTAKCNACHGHLGANPSFHAGQRNDGPTCSWCHNPNRTSSGWSANAKDFIHAIHASAKRTVPFTWHAVSATENFSEVTYPLSGNNSGLLRKCDACHVAGYYDYSAGDYTANGGDLKNRLMFSTVATGSFASSSTSSFAFSPYVSLDTDYGSGFSYNAGTGVTTTAAGSTLVTSPITAACVACHDSMLAKDHMKVNGGSIYKTRSTAIKP